jgi:hypothetical protein
MANPPAGPVVVAAVMACGIPIKAISHLTSWTRNGLVALSVEVLGACRSDIVQLQSRVMPSLSLGTGSDGAASGVLDFDHAWAERGP